MSLQGPGENVLTSSDKILRFKRKLNLWKNHVVKGNLEMLPMLLGLEGEEGYQQVLSCIENHHENCRTKLNTTQVYDWVSNPYCESSAQPKNLIFREEEELCELQTDYTFKIFTDLSLDKFWISVKDEYPAIHRKAITTLPQFSTSYMCEQVFSF
jgi:hypothetical protein